MNNEQSVITLESIFSNLDCRYETLGPARDGREFCSLFEPVEGGISWMRAKEDSAIEQLATSPVAILFCHKMLIDPTFQLGKTLIFVDNPQLRFMQTVKRLSNRCEKLSAGIHPTAIIAEGAVIGQNVFVGAFAQIGKCVIGNDVVIKSNATIHSGAHIGNRVLISEYCNIGGQGFGHIKNDFGMLENQPHIGTVILEDDVEIFPYSNVDRGTLGVTRVGRGTKIDHYCHIGHNTKIGKSNLITPNVTTLGGVIIGDQCMIGCGTQIRESVVIGNQVTIGMSSTVTKNVPDNETWLGSPAVEISIFKKRQTLSTLG